jgi:serine/threonine protein kinase
MAPETIREGEYSERSDLYAWGIVLYEMLHGQPPFNAKTGDALKYKHVNEPPKPLRELRPEVPVALEHIVMQALEKDPVRRPANMQAVITALRTVDVTTTREPTAPTIILNAQQALGSQVEKKPEIPVTVRLPEPPQEQKRRGIQVNPKWLGVSLVVVMAGMLTFILLPSMRETGAIPKIEPRPVSVEQTSPTKPPPSIPQANDRTAETRKKISDHLGMAKFYEDNGQINEAKTEFEAVLALDSGNQDARDGMKRVNGTSVVDEATKKQVQDYLGMAKFYSDEGQPEDAIAQLEAAKKLDPNNQEVTTMLKQVQAVKKKRR